MNLTASFVSPIRTTAKSLAEKPEAFYVADEEIRKLQEDLTLVAHNLQIESSIGVNASYCVDFDVIRSAIDWFDESSQESLWSALSIFFPTTGIVFLPGTLYEILKYLKRQRQVLEKEHAPPPALAAAFLKTFEFDSAKPALDQNSFSSALKSFVSGRISSNKLFALEMLKQRLVSSSNHPRPCVDLGIFERARSILDYGKRNERTINNRVDALNYSFACQLNGTFAEHGQKYYLVSNAPSLRRLDRFLSSDPEFRGFADNFSGGIVVTARVAAIHQILVKVGGGTAEGERLAYELLFDLTNYRRKLANLKLHSSRGRREISDSTAESTKELNALLHSFNVFQDQIDNFGMRQSTALQLFDISYDKSNPKKFYDSLDQRLSKFLEESGYGERDFEGALPGIHISSVAAEGKAPFTYVRSYEFRIGPQSVGAYARCYSDHLAFFTTSAAPINEFISAAGQVYSSLVSKLKNGTYSGVADIRPERICVGVLECEPRVFSFVGTQIFSLERICHEIESLPESITFLRFEFAHFAASFEGDALVFVTDQLCAEEAGMFLDELIEPRFKNREIRSAVTEVFEFWRDNCATR